MLPKERVRRLGPALDPDLPLPSDSPCLCPEIGHGCAHHHLFCSHPGSSTLAPAPLLVEVVGPRDYPASLALHLPPAWLPTGLLGLSACAVPEPTEFQHTCTQARASSPSEKCPIQAPLDALSRMKTGPLRRSGPAPAMTSTLRHSTLLTHVTPSPASWMAVERVAPPVGAPPASTSPEVVTGTSASPAVVAAEPSSPSAP